MTTNTGKEILEIFTIWGKKTKKNKRHIYFLK